MLRIAALAAFCLALLGLSVGPRALPAAAQDLTPKPLPLPGGGARPSNPAAAVQFMGPRQVTVPAGRAALLQLHFRVADGMHINSHAPLQKSLIPTRLAVVEDTGIRVTAVDFPPGAGYSLAMFPKDKLSVYSGEFALRAHLNVPPGEHLLEAGLHYQACDVNSCQPPQTLPVEIGILAK